MSMLEIQMQCQHLDAGEDDQKAPVAIMKVKKGGIYTLKMRMARWHQENGLRMTTNDEIHQ